MFVSEMEQEPEIKRRWSGYVCPECRFVFRIPRDYDGEGVVCLSCRRLLRVPGEGDKTAALVKKAPKIEFSQDDGDGGLKGAVSKRGESKLFNVLGTIFLVVATLALITFVTIFLVQEIYYGNEHDGLPVVEEVEEEVESFEDLIGVPLLGVDVDGAGESEAEGLPFGQ